MPKARRINRSTPSSPQRLPAAAISGDRLLGDIRALIDGAREQT
jgi:hypothetical protein